VVWGGIFVAKIGIIAGNGRFPKIFASAARELGYEVILIALKNETMEETTTVVNEVHWVELGELQRVIDILKESDIRDIVMAGKIRKTVLFSSDLKLDERSRKLFQSLKDNNDDSILKAYVDELEKEGLTVLDSITLIKNLLPSEGCLTIRKPTDEELENIKYGWERAKNIAGMDIGQTIVVKNKAVVAVEAIEGTDHTIRRGGRFAKEGITVIKVAKPKQDNRFDVPVIGLDTIDVLIEVKASAIVVEADKTIFLDREKAIEKANKHNIMILAFNGDN
jgi:DUF1009 family protein